MSDGEMADKLLEIFDMRPKAIEERLSLRNPIYEETAAYGHMGRKSEKKKKTFVLPNGQMKECEVELFTWEKVDFAEQLKAEFLK